MVLSRSYLQAFWLAVHVAMSGLSSQLVEMLPEAVIPFARIDVETEACAAIAANGVVTITTFELTNEHLCPAA